MTITTTVRFDDLIAAVERELDDLRAQYEDTVALIEDEYGDDALDRELPDTSEVEDDDVERLAGLRMTAHLYDEGGKENQKRKHALERLREEYDDGTFEVRMLTGQEVMDIETQLKMQAQREDVDQQTVNHERRTLVADAAVSDAPDGFPEEDGDPKPSEAPQALMFALYEQAERLNSAGAADFTAPGFGDADPSPPASSATPSTSPPSPTPSAPTDANTDDSGKD